MQSIVESVSAVTVWSSLFASLILCSFATVQSILDQERRWRFALFALVCGTTLSLDLLFPILDKFTYEYLRVFAWGTYGPSIAYLLGASLLWFVSATTFCIIAGLSTWYFVDPNLATTVTLPCSFAIAGAAHGVYYQWRRGYASCVLAATSLCQAFQCALFYSFIALRVPAYNAFGYLHYASMAVCAAIFGWVHLARELRGMAPVLVSRRAALCFAVAFCLPEAVILPPFYVLGPEALHVAVVGALIQFSVILIFFFYHRHLLVVHTDNVTALLERRTASLRHAQQELAARNELQAELLEEQAQSLHEQSVVIERQRRLELAAQTAGQAAHDIQNLIAPLMNYLEIMERGGSERLTFSELTRRMRLTVQDLRELNAQLLTLGRRGQTELTEIDVVDLIEEIGARFEDLRIGLSASSGLTIKGSWAQLLRALTNLIVNAREASTPHPVSLTATISDIEAPRRCHLGYVQPGSYVVIEVKDQGSGIPGEIIDRIFEPFFSSKKRSHGSGSGLGLSIVAAVVSDHNGILDLHTGAQGTTFQLYVPLLNAALLPSSKRSSDVILKPHLIIFNMSGIIPEEIRRDFNSTGLTLVAISAKSRVLALLEHSPIEGLLIDASIEENDQVWLSDEVSNVCPNLPVFLLCAQQGIVESNAGARFTVRVLRSGKNSAALSQRINSAMVAVASAA